MRRRLAVVFTVFVCLLAAVSCWSQVKRPSGNLSNRTFFIQGSVRRYDNNQTVELVKVDLKKLAGEVVATTFTRSNGDFEFRGLSAGTYYLVVEEKGYEPIRENIEITMGSRPGVYLFLKRPLEVRTSEPGGTTISAHELSMPAKARQAMKNGMKHLYEKNDFKGSLDDFGRALKDAPSYYEAHEEMGVAYVRLGDLLRAEQAFRKSIEVSENKYAAAYFRLASLLSDNRRFAEAEPLARKGVELDSNAWQGHFELARALTGLNRTEDAEKSTQEALTRNSAYAPIYLVLANIHIHRHDYAALVGDLDIYLKLDPDGPMSQQARETREKVKAFLAKAQNAPAAVPPKP